MKTLSRRSMLQAVAAAAAAALPRRSAAELETMPPTRAITRGPKFHWFAYYDKLQFDRTNTKVLAMEVDFEHRSPRPDDVVRVGLVDLADGDRWTPLGQSTAWCWQQGCMLQWRPGHDNQIVWNDRAGDRYVARILDLASGAVQTVDHPIYALSPDGRWAIATDFRRLGDTRPGYGYVGIPDPNANVLAPKDAGIWRIDLVTGRSELIFSMADAAAIPFPGREMTAAKHWFNHLLVNTDGTRIEFLHRFKGPNERSWATRMFTANPDGSAVRAIDQNGLTSHFIWRDPRHILSYSKQPPDDAGFYLFEDAPGGRIERVGRGVMKSDGHCTYLPGNAWILCDTYPQGKERTQNVYLYHPASNRQVWLGRFHLPKEYSGEWRCDTHPRFSRDGRLVTVDSPHTGQGRQVHLIDVGAIVG